MYFWVKRERHKVGILGGGGKRRCKEDRRDKCKTGLERATGKEKSMKGQEMSRNLEENRLHMNAREKGVKSLRRQSKKENKKTSLRNGESLHPLMAVWVVGRVSKNSPSWSVTNTRKRQWWSPHASRKVFSEKSKKPPKWRQVTKKMSVHLSLGKTGGKVGEW